MRISVEQAASRMEELARRVIAGEEVIITDENGPDIRVVPVPEEEWPRYGYTKPEL